MTKEGVLQALKVLGPKIERADAKRADLYDEQRVLVIAGYEAGLRATEMARARRPGGDVEDLAEYYRQKIRVHKKSQPKAARSRG